MGDHEESLPSLSLVRDIASAIATNINGGRKCCPKSEHLWQITTYPLIREEANISSSPLQVWFAIYESFSVAAWGNGDRKAYHVHKLPRLVICTLFSSLMCRVK